MDRQVKMAAIALVTLLAIIAVLQPLISQTDRQPFSELAVLGPASPSPAELPTCNQSQTELGNYPQNVSVGEPSCLFGYVENHDGSPEYYRILVKLGNIDTVVSNTTAAFAPIVFQYFALVQNNESSTFRIGYPPYVWGNGLLSYANIGEDQRLIFELWAYSPSSSTFYYTGTWNEIWVNVTAP